MTSHKHLVLRIVTALIFFLSTLTAPIFAYGNGGVRNKTAPVKYHLAPLSLPQIPLNAFYNQRYFNRFNPEKRSLEIVHGDFSLSGVDGLAMLITRHYHSDTAAE